MRKHSRSLEIRFSSFSTRLKHSADSEGTVCSRPENPCSTRNLGASYTPPLPGDPQTRLINDGQELLRHSPSRACGHRDVGVRINAQPTPRWLMGTCHQWECSSRELSRLCARVEALPSDSCAVMHHDSAWQHRQSPAKRPRKREASKASVAKKVSSSRIQAYNLENDKFARKLPRIHSAS